MKDEFTEYQSMSWTIKYPSNWIAEKHKENVSFYVEYGVGALQISAYSKNEEVSEEDLIEFVSEKVPKDEDLRKIELSGYTGLETDYKYFDHYWRMWFLKKGNTILYVTYNCEFEDRETERDTINEIVKSLN